MDEPKSKKSLKPTNGDLLRLAESQTDSTFIGIIENLPLYSDIIRSRKFFVPNSYLGHTYGKSVLALFNSRPEAGMDMYVTDQYGILKNSLNAHDYRTRMSVGEKNNTPSIWFFGGSTMMGMGARTPDHSIPALVEKNLREQHNLETVCVNFGVGGTYCLDAFNLMSTHLMLHNKPDIVIFYDGWNCCSYPSLIETVASDSAQTTAFAGGLRQLEHSLLLSNLFKPSWLAQRALKLMISCCLDMLGSSFNSAKLKHLLTWMNLKFLTSRPIEDIVRRQNQSKNYFSPDTKASSRAALEYIHIHNCAKAICSSNDIKFKTFLQPLLFWGNKKKTPNEKTWLKNSHSTADGSVFKGFYEELTAHYTQCVDRTPFVDLTNVFDMEKEELFIDSGHLNRRGNTLVAKSIASSLIKNELRNC